MTNTNNSKIIGTALLVYAGATLIKLTLAAIVLVGIWLHFYQNLADPEILKYYTGTTTGGTVWHVEATIYTILLWVKDLLRVF